MAQTATTLADVLKERWSDDELQRQFESKAGFLSRLESVKGTQIGKQVQVPIEKNLVGGYTSVGAAGGSLNTAGNAGVDQATYTLVYHWQPISVDASALGQAPGSSIQSVVGAKNLEVKSALDVIRKHAERQAVMNGDGSITATGTTAGAAEVELNATQGFHAITAGWLQIGTVVDIGSTADTDDAGITGEAITAIERSASTPSITVTSNATTDANDDVYIANPNSASAANTEMNGLRNLVNTTGAVGGLNPATAGEDFWAAAARDTSTTVFSLDFALDLQVEVLGNSGEMFTDVVTSYKQQANFYSLLQNQVRFAGDMKLGAGNQAGVAWNNMKVDAYPAIQPTDWFCLTLSDLLRVSGAWSKPTWASKIAGHSGLAWSQGTTRFVDGLVFPMQIGLRRRNSHAAGTALT